MLIEGTGPPEDLPKDEAESWMDAFLDPLRANAGRNVCYEQLPGVGEVAVAVVEKADPARGIARDGAVLVLKRGNRQVSLLSSDLARRDRAEGLREGANNHGPRDTLGARLRDQATARRQLV